MDQQSDGFAYRDESASTEQRVDSLLSEMTFAEKAAQLGSINAGEILEDGAIDWDAVEDHLGDGIGHLTRIGGEGSLPPERAAEVTNELQTYLREETRLGVPAIAHEECLSGYMGPQGTTFPQSIGTASTFDPSLMEEITATIRGELEAIGTAHALSPVLDVARDLRWGRVEETFGEDPLLVAAMATGYVDGLQGDAREGISATLKHFVGHGGTEGGKNRASLKVGPRELRETHLFPYEAAIELADAESVMNAYHDVDGVPCAKNEWLLTDVLRGDFGFDGTVVSDYYSIELLREEHGVAETQREAGVAALEAGLDVELPFTDCYGENLVEAVERGELAEETLDTSVRRILRMKFDKGVFDDPTVDAAAAPDAFDTEDATAVSARAARESMTLLENDGLLPLSDSLDEIAVLGPKADDPQELLGDYAYAAHYPDEETEFTAVTPLEAVSSRGNEVGFEVTYEQGCTISGPETDGFDDAAAAAEDADVAVAFVGARSAVEFDDADADKRKRPTVATSGEGCDMDDLGLPGVQQELVRHVNESDTPLVVVLVSGKPHSIPWISENVPAVLEAWLPGEEGATAIADTLFGDVNPGGHLPISIARDVGQIPIHYNRKPNTANKDHVYTDSAPLYPFGHGLHYTEFEYGDLELSESEILPSDSVTAEVTVSNAGDRAGTEVVQLYAAAENPSQARPVQELVGFERVELGTGETKRVTVEIDASQLAFHDLDMNLAVEEGAYELRVGVSSAEIVASESVAVTDTKTVPHSGRTYFPETDVESAD